MQQFILDLGVKLGYGADFWNGDMAACQNYQLEPLGMTVDQLRTQHPTGLTFENGPMAFEKYEKIFTGKSPRLGGAPYLPQGKVALYNTSFEEAATARARMARTSESLTGTPELTDRYPLLLSDYNTSVNYTPPGSAMCLTCGRSTRTPCCTSILIPPPPEASRTATG
jgi:hypothetical protein